MATAITSRPQTDILRIVPATRFMGSLLIPASQMHKLTTKFQDTLGFTQMLALDVSLRQSTEVTCRPDRQLLFEHSSGKGKGTQCVVVTGSRQKSATCATISGWRTT